MLGRRLRWEGFSRSDAGSSPAGTNKRVFLPFLPIFLSLVQENTSNEAPIEFL